VSLPNAGNDGTYLLLLLGGINQGYKHEVLKTRFTKMLQLLSQEVLTGQPKQLITTKKIYYF
jgi:hypothetical protein